MLEQSFDCVAVPLPESFREEVEAGVVQLPRPSIVIQRPTPTFEQTPDWQASEWTPDRDESDGAGEDDDDEARLHSYVPIDPCDAMIEATRIAQRERAELHFIDAEVEEFEPRPMVVPDAHAIHGLGLERWYDAILPALREFADETGCDLRSEVLESELVDGGRSKSDGQLFDALVARVGRRAIDDESVLS